MLADRISGAGPAPAQGKACARPPGTGPLTLPSHELSLIAVLDKCVWKKKKKCSACDLILQEPYTEEPQHEEHTVEEQQQQQWDQPAEAQPQEQVEEQPVEEYQRQQEYQQEEQNYEQPAEEQQYEQPAEDQSQQQYVLFLLVAYIHAV